MACWILSTVRTGSSYLSNLLNETGCFPSVVNDKSFGEWYGKFSHHDFSGKLLPYVKIHAEQLRRVKPVSSDTRRWIESNFVDIKFILLRRRNICDQAVSFCIAKKYKKFYLSSHELVSWEERKINLSDDELIQAYNELKDCYVKWDNFLLGCTNFMEVEYEDLVSKPYDVVCNIFDFCGMDSSLLNGKVESTSIRMTKDENKIYSERLNNLI